MMGLEGLGAALMALAFALMCITPLHLTIGRSKPKSVPISAALHEVYDEQEEAPDLEALADQAEQALAHRVLNGAGRNRTKPH